MPAAILLVTAYQLLSDRDTLFGGPKPVVWSSPTTDGSAGGSSGRGSGSTAVQGDGGDPFKLPRGFTPVTAEPCALEPERPLDWQGNILAVPGGPGSDYNVKHTAQVRA